MKTMSLILINYLLPSLLLFLSTSTSATLMSKDDIFFGPDSVTRQSNGREWLDASLSAGCSFDDVINKTGCGSTFIGWRHATSLEILDLWDEAGFGPGFHGFGDEFFAIDNLRGLLSGFIEDGPSPPEGPGSVGFVSGVFDDTSEGTNSQLVGRAFFLLSPDVDSANAAIFLDDFSITRAEPFTSNWLVRSIPEPSIFALVITGLIGFTLRKRTNKTS